MACEIYFDDVRSFRETSSKLLEKARMRGQVSGGGGGGGGARCSLRLDFAGAAPPAEPSTTASLSAASLASPPCQLDLPLMKEMDEITYWLCTRRAPCLLKHDLARRRREEAHCSRPQLVGSIHSISDTTRSPTPKKKKRKLSILDDESISVKEPKNLFFDTSNQQQKHTLISSSKSDAADPDSNIKRSSLQDQLKRRKLQKHNMSKLHKKNKMVSSTPIANVRRSLRNSRKGFNDSSQLNSSFEIMNGENTQNGVKKNNLLTPSKLEYVRPKDKCRKLIDKLDMDLKQAKAALQRFPNGVSKPIKAINGEFENFSDVSGFTANYIRSTKSAIKNGKKVKSKNCRNLLKDCSDVHDQSKQLGCEKARPSVTKLPHSHNSTNESRKATRVHRTSILKSPNKDSCSHDQVDGNITSDNLDSSLSPSKMCLRYPRRQNTSGIDDFAILKLESSLNSTRSPKNRRKTSRIINNNNNSCQDVDALPRTRSRSALASSLEQGGAAGATGARGRGRRAAPRDPSAAPRDPSTAPRDPSAAPRDPSTAPRDRSAALRDRSGFAACFSDSDDEKPLKKQKFFG